MPLVNWRKSIPRQRSKRARSESSTIKARRMYFRANVDRLEERRLLSVSPVGPETLVNQSPGFVQDLAENSNSLPTSTNIEPSNRSVAMDSNGDFIVTWTSYGGQDGDGKGVYARLYDKFGQAVTNEFQVNQFTLGDQWNSSVAMDVEGDFVIVWQSDRQDPYDGSAGVFARRYNAAGQAVSDEFRVNTVTLGQQIHPSIGMNYGGDFVITWEGTAENGSFFNDIKAQRYSYDGSQLGSEFRVNEANLPGVFSEAYPKVAVAETGNFVITYDTRIRDFVQNFAQSSFVSFRLFDNNGMPLTQTTRVSLVGDDVWTNVVDTNAAISGQIDVSSTLMGERNSSVAMDAEGNFTIAWESFQDNDLDPPPNTIESFGVVMRRYHADGRPSTFLHETEINPVFTSPGPLLSIYSGDQLNPSVGLNADGLVVAVYSGQGSSDGTPVTFDDTGIWYRRFDPSSAFDYTDPNTGVTIMEPGGTGGLNFPPIGVNSTRQGTQRHPTVAVNRNGDFVVVWSGSGAGDPNGIYFQRYVDADHRAGPLVGRANVNGKAIANNQQVVDVVNTLVVTFDEQMSVAGGATGNFSVLNPKNWKLLKNGVPLLNAISNITFQLNPTTNKFEATLTLDGNGVAPGTEALPDGAYQLIALNVIRDVLGNPLTSIGQTPNGVAFQVRFNVVRSQLNLASEQVVNATLPGIQTTDSDSPQTVASSADGTTVIVWSGLGKNAAGNSVQGVFYSQYDSSGVVNPALKEVFVSSETPGTNVNPAVAIDGDGDFVITWSNYGPNSTSWDVYIQRYSSQGDKEGANQRANSTTQDIQRLSTVAMDATGEFVVAWQSYNQDGSGYGIYAQRYTAAGEPVAGTNEVQTLTFNGTPVNGQTFSLKLGNFVYGPILYTTEDFGAKLAGDIERAFLNGIPSEQVSVKANNPKQFVITFLGASGSANKPKLQVVASTLTATVAESTQGVSGEFLVNDTTANNQTNPVVSSDSTGKFVVTWVSAGQDGDSAFETNIYSKLYTSNLLLLGPGSQNETVQAVQTGNTTAATSNLTSEENFTAGGKRYDGSGSLDYTLGGTVPGKWGPPQFGTGAVVTYAFMDDKVVDTDNLDGGWTNIPVDTFMPAGAKDQIRAAFAAWAKVANLTFVEVTDSGEKFGAPGTADIRIGGHQITDTNVLAHGFLPPVNGVGAPGVAGDLHFNSLDKWKIGFGGDPNATDIFQVAAHEIGHALGLGHTNVPNSLMDPFYSEVFRGPQTDDIAGMQFIYGAANAGAITSEFRVNQTVAGNQFQPSVSMDPAGEFVVSWTSYGQDGGGNGYGPGIAGTNGVYARRFNASGQGAAPAVFSSTYNSTNVPLPIADGTVGTLSYIDVPDDFIVTGVSITFDITHPRDGDLRGILFGPSSNPLAGGVGPVLFDQVGGIGENFHGTTLNDTATVPIANGVPPFTGTFLPDSTLASLTGQHSKGRWYFGINDLVVGKSGTLNGWSIKLTGVVDGGNEFKVNSTTANNQQNSRVAMDGTGGFTVTWESFQDDTAAAPGIPASYGIYAQKYASQAQLSTGPFGIGGAIGNEFQVPFTKDGDQRFPGVATDRSGNLTFVWSGNGVGDNAGVFTRRIINESDRSGPVVTDVLYLANEEQTLSISGDPTGGTFRLRIGGFETAASIPFLTTNNGADTAAAIQAALAAQFPGITVTAESTSSFLIKFVGLKNVDTIEVIDPQFTPGPNTPNPGSVETTIQGGSLSVPNGKVLDTNVAQLVVRFNKELRAVSVDDPQSVINVDNWVLTRNGVVIDGAIKQVLFGKSEASVVGLGAPSNKWEAVVVFDSDPTEPGNQPLGNGDYVLVALPSIVDATPQKNPLDGNNDGVGGDPFSRSFTIRIPPPRGNDEFPVNTTTDGNAHTDVESPGAVASDAEGNYVVVWTAPGPTGVDAVFMQRYDVRGVRQGGEIRVSPGTTADDTQINNHATVAMDGDGDFVVTWTGYGQNGDAAGQANIYAQRFAKNGTLQGVAQRVNSTAAGNQKWSTVAMDVLGDFVVTWSAADQDGSGYGVYARRYNSQGRALGAEILINQTTLSDQRLSDVAADADGNFVVTWMSGIASSPGGNIFARRYTSAGIAASDEFQVNTRGLATSRYARVSADLAGDFVVTWTAFGADGAGNGDGVFARQYSRLGDAALPEFQVNVTAARNQSFSDVSLDHQGNFVVVWAGIGNQTGQEDDVTPGGIFGRRFAFDGTPLPPPGTAGGADEFRINTTIDGAQNFPSVAANGSGAFVVVWSGNGNGDNQGIFGRQFTSEGDIDGPIVTDVTVMNQGTDLQIRNGDSVSPAAAITQFKVNFGEEMFKGANVTDSASVLNPANWALVRNGSEVFGAIQSIDFEKDPITRKWTATLTLDLSTFGAGTTTLPEGNYLLIAHEFMTDLSGNALDGNYDGVPGVDFIRTFNVTRSIETGAPQTVNTVDAGKQYSLDITQSNDTDDKSSQIIASDDEGDFVVVWTADTTRVGESGKDIAYRLYRKNDPNVPSEVGPVPRGDEMRVSQAAVGNEPLPAVAMDADGDFVIVWVRDNSIIARVFSATGAPLSDNPNDIVITQGTTLTSNYPSVAMNARGDFAVTWTGINALGDANVYVRGFSKEGNALTSALQANEQVNTYTNNNISIIPAIGRPATIRSTITVPDSFLLTDVDVNFSIDFSPTQNLQVALVSPTGTRVLLAGGVGGNGINFTNTTLNDQAGTAIANGTAPFNGSFRPSELLSLLNGQQAQGDWQLEVADTVGQSIFLPNGGSLLNWSITLAHSGIGATSTSTSADSSPQQKSQIAMDASGNVVVVWEDQGRDGDGSSVFGQLFDTQGNAIGSNFQVNQTTELDQRQVSVASDRRSGNFVVAWSSDRSDGTAEAFVQRFTRLGARLGVETPVSDDPTGSEYHPVVTMDALGNFVVAWDTLPTSTTGDGIASNIVARRFTSNSTPRGGDFIVADTDFDQRYPAIAGDGNGDFVVAWTASHADDDFQGTIRAQAYGYSQFLDTTGPIVADVLDASGRRIEEGEPITADPNIGLTEIQITFGEAMNSLDPTDRGPTSVFNPANWAVARSGTSGSGGVVLVTPSATDASGRWIQDPTTNKWTVILTLDSTPADAARTGFTPGDYVLTLRRNVRDTDGNQLDGTYVGSTGQSGSDFTFRFTIADIRGGNPFQVNADSLLDSQHSDVARDADGNYVVVWESNGQILGQVFNTVGRKRGTQFIVTDAEEALTIRQSAPRVAMADDGTFVVVWQGGLDEQNEDDQGIYARRYNRFGAAQSDIFRVNTTLANNQFEPDIAMAGDGRFTVTWASLGDSRDSDGVFAQRFDALGNKTGGEFLVNQITVQRQDKPSIAMNDAGSFVITFDSFNTDGNGLGVYGQRYNASGVAQGGEFQINTFTAGTQSSSSVGIDNNGNFVVTWQSFEEEGQGLGFGVYARRYGSNGAAIGGEIHVNTFVLNYQVNPAVAVTDDGNFAISWDSAAQDLDRRGVYLRLFRSDGSTVPDPSTGDAVRLVNLSIDRDTGARTELRGDQFEPAIAADDLDSFVVTWTNIAPFVSTTIPPSNIFARQFGNEFTTIAVAGLTAADTAVLDLSAPNGGNFSLNGVVTPLAKLQSLDFTGVGGSSNLLVIGGSTGQAATLSPGSGTIRSGNFSFSYTNVPTVKVKAGSTADVATIADGSGPNLLDSTAQSSTLTAGAYTVTVESFSNLKFLGGAGQSRAVIHGATQANTLTMKPLDVQMTSAGLSRVVEGFTKVDVYSGNSSDKASIYGSAGNDLLAAGVSSTTISAAGYANSASGFRDLHAYSGAGRDSAVITGSTGDDMITLKPMLAQFLSNTAAITAEGFAQIKTIGNGGNDQAFLYGSTDTNTLTMNPTQTVLTGDKYLNTVQGIKQTRAFADANSTSSAYFYTSTGADQLLATPAYTQLTGAGFLNYAKGFQTVRAYANGTQATATLQGGTGVESLVAAPTYSQLSGANFTNYAKGFSQVNAQSTSGKGQALIYSGDGDSDLVSTQTSTTLTSANNKTTALGFSTMRAYASLAGGTHTASLYSGNADSTLLSTPSYTQLRSTGFSGVALNFNSVNVVGGTGHNTASVYSTGSNDHLVSQPGLTQLDSGVHSQAIRNFADMHVQGTAGQGTATLYGQASGSTQALVGSQSVQLSGTGYQSSVSGFGQLTVQGSGSNNLVRVVDAVMAGGLTVGNQEVRISTALWNAQFNAFTTPGGAGGSSGGSSSSSQLSAVDQFFADEN